MSTNTMLLKMIESVHGVENILGYTFSDKSIIWEALQAPGSGVYNSGSRPISGKGNKRLALMGDAAAELVLRVYWYKSGSQLGLLPFAIDHPIYILD